MKLPHGRKVRPRWWAFVNWTRGLKWSPVGRYRCCDHTTPYHSRWCPQHPMQNDSTSDRGRSDG